MPHITRMSTRNELLLNVILMLSEELDLKGSDKDVGLALLSGDGLGMQNSLMEDLNIKVVVDVIKNEMTLDQRIRMIESITEFFDNMELTDPKSTYDMLMEEEHESFRQGIVDALIAFFLKEFHLFVI